MKTTPRLNVINLAVGRIGKKLTRVRCLTILQPMKPRLIYSAPKAKSPEKGDDAG